jgi:hypothetical protein
MFFYIQMARKGQIVKNTYSFVTLVSIVFKVFRVMYGITNFAYEIIMFHY